jgi:hypothetical protein
MDGHDWDPNKNRYHVRLFQGKNDPKLTFVLNKKNRPIVNQSMYIAWPIALSAQKAICTAESTKTGSHEKQHCFKLSDFKEEVNEYRKRFS